jgi:heat shock protein HtpX
MSKIPTKDLRKAEPFNAFYFAPALSSGSGNGSGSGMSLGRLFSTHPTLEQRLEQLARITVELGSR